MNVLDEIVEGYGEFDDCPVCLAFDILLGQRSFEPHGRAVGHEFSVYK